MSCSAAQHLEKKESRRMRISPGSPSSSRLLAARDPLGHSSSHSPLEPPSQDGKKNEAGVAFWETLRPHPPAGSALPSWLRQGEKSPDRQEKPVDKSEQVGRKRPALCHEHACAVVEYRSQAGQTSPRGSCL